MLQSIARLGETFRGSTGTALCFDNMLLVTWILKFLGLETSTETGITVAVVRDVSALFALHVLRLLSAWCMQAASA